MTKNTKLLLPCLLGFLGFVLLETILFHYVDLPLSLYMRELDKTNPDIINFFRAITDLAKAKWHLLLSFLGCATCAILLRTNIGDALRQRIAASINGLLAYFLAIATSGIITNLFKDTLGRARPVLYDREGLYGFFPFHFDATYNSIPSGHATTAMALTAILYHFDRKRGALWIAIGLLLTVSRVIVNAHYLSDIVAGSLIGGLTALVVIRNINHNGINLAKSRIFPIDKKDKLS